MEEETKIFEEYWNKYGKLHVFVGESLDAAMVKTFAREMFLSGRDSQNNLPNTYKKLWKKMKKVNYPVNIPQYGKYTLSVNELMSKMEAGREVK